LSAAPTTALGLLAALATGKTSPLELAFELAVFQASAWVTRATGSAAAGNLAGGVVRQIAPALKRGGSFSVQAVGQALMGAVLAPVPSPAPGGAPLAPSPGVPGLDPGLLIARDRTREIWAALHAPPSGTPATRHRWDDTYDEEAIVTREAPSPVLTRPQAATPATVRPPAQPVAIHVAGSPGVNATAPRVRRSAPGTLLMPAIASPAELSALQPTPAEKSRVEPAVSERLVAVWRAMGGDSGLLGARSGAPFRLADGVGSGLACERGAVVGHPEFGAFALTFGIFDTWVRTGAESGPLGYPVRPETQVTGGAAEARVARLQGGLIVDWQPLGDRDPPPFVILAGDALVRAWLDGGAEQSPVGTPVAPPQDIGPQDLPQRSGSAPASAGAAQARVLFCSHGALAYTEREGLRYLRAQDYADWLRQLR
jgi:hypothetical protein